MKTPASTRYHWSAATRASPSCRFGSYLGCGQMVITGVPKKSLCQNN